MAGAEPDRCCVVVQTLNLLFQASWGTDGLFPFLGEMSDAWSIPGLHEISRIQISDLSYANSAADTSLFRNRHKCPPPSGLQAGNSGGSWLLDADPRRRLTSRPDQPIVASGPPILSNFPTLGFPTPAIQPANVNHPMEWLWEQAVGKSLRTAVVKGPSVINNKPCFVLLEERTN